MIWYFICHLGLGDAIILSAAVIHYAETGKVYFPCLGKYLKSVRSFFVLYPQVTVFVIDSDSEALVHETSSVLSGYPHSDPIPGESLDVWFYRQMGLPFEYRWSKCPIASASKHCPQYPVPDYPYAFVHENPGRPMTKLKTDLPIIRPDKFEGVLPYCDLIENAAEGHYDNSAFQQLANCLKPSGKLFWHRYARPSSNRVFETTKSLHHWNIIDW